MALAYSTIFGRLGRLFRHAQEVRTYQATLDTQYASTVGQYSGGDMGQIGVLSRNLEGRKIEATQTSEDLRAAAIKTLIDLTDANFSIRTKTLDAALGELIKQMIADSQTVNGNTVTVGTVSAGSGNVGNGTMVYSSVAPAVDRYGNKPGNIYLQNLRTETLRAVCVLDSTSTSVDESNERFEFTGQRDVVQFDQDWPVGSGVRVVQGAISPKVDGARSVGKNVGTNSDFENFTSNAPDHWTIATGSAGTHILAAGAGYSGSNALKFVGDGSTTPRIYQRLRVTSETLGQIKPDRPYLISFAAKYATLAPGVSLRVCVEDDSGTRLNEGFLLREMSRTVLSGSLTTSYQLFSAAVFSPLNIPKGSRLVVEMNGNMANTSEVFIDNVSISEMRSLGPGLGAVGIVPGSTAFRRGDTFEVAITNNEEGSVVKEFDRFFDMQGKGLALPGDTTGSETILDSVIA